MEMHQVRYFLAMARLLNFTRAADECNVTQPSLTRAVQKLEEEFGGKLFRRERSRTHLTDLGRMMLPHLERTHEAACCAKELARGMGKAQIARLALGVATGIESASVSEILAELASHLAGFDVSVVGGSSAELIEQGLSGTLDLVVVERPDAAHERLETWPLFTHDYRMVTHASHAQAGQESVAFAQAAAETWIDCGGDGIARLHALADSRGVTLDVRHAATTEQDKRRLVIAKLGNVCAPAAFGAGTVALRFVDVDASRDVVLGAIGGRQRSTTAASFVTLARARRWSR